MRTPRDPEATIDMMADSSPPGGSNTAATMEGIGVSIRGIVNSRSGVVELGADPGLGERAVKELLEARLQRRYTWKTMCGRRLWPIQFGNPGGSRQPLPAVGCGGRRCGHRHGARRQNLPWPPDGGGRIRQMVILAGDSRNGTTVRDVWSVWPPIRLAIGTRRWPATRLLPAPGNVAARVRMICHRAKNGEEAARTAMQETCRYLGIGISNVVWGLDVDTVIIHRVITEAWAIVAPIILDTSGSRPDDHPPKPHSAAVAVWQRSIAGGSGDASISAHVYRAFPEQKVHADATLNRSAPAIGRE